ncbi:uncharacterized protein CANTADRAFT_7122 [Suhomyces tanzawaensis NRRL Y-17324]|uniref:Plasma membrane fusion protein PRM1 n=1 Tax=Suhomyces tanzawaensis NRRL Y-17324 TaxID=984487 RepID=A0A1E4SH05_9ASCO|nr:uncharacterized protein CANTADRAFT_7122 [Suhomyces tanzawaensis NRRL Y-17324]ODV78788.1 hypothetical protein CANTADRAFT_7122 [Suhomyces tanzawaensis NRRL Y-17324]
MPPSKQYLSPLETLSQVYLNKYSLVLALVAIKVYLFKRAVLANIDAVALQNECDKLANEYPGKVSLLINSYILDNLSKARYSYLVLIQALVSTVKHLVLFYVELFLGTYTCLLNAAVSGTANFAVDTSKNVIVMVNSTIVDVTHDIQDGLDGLSAVIQTLVSSLDKIKAFFTGKDPTTTQYEDKIKLSIGALRKLSIPTSVLSSIEEFRNSTVPTFDQLQNTTSVLIASPFDLVSRKLGESSFNSSLDSSRQLLGNESLPVMPNGACSSRIADTVSQLHKDVDLAAKKILFGIVAAAVVVCLPLAYTHVRAWRREARLMDELEDSHVSPVVMLNVLNRYENPLLYYLHKFAGLRRTSTIWLINYITSVYSRVVLMMGFTGLIAVLSQWMLLRIFVDAIKQPLDPKPTSTNSTVDVSKAFIADTNKYIAAQELILNEELFGHIHNVSTSLNSTLVTFMANLNRTVNDMFGRTPLSGPINTIVYCTLGRKVEKIENGITWLNKNLKIAIPLVDEGLETQIENLITSKNVMPMAQDGLRSIELSYKNTLRWELYVSIGLCGLWVIQIITGISILLFKHYLSRNSGSTISSVRDKFMVDPATIGDPKPLTLKERQSYGYPFCNPYEESKLPKKYLEDEKDLDPCVRSSSIYGSSHVEFPTRTSSTVRTYNH